jgi:IgGFc binding protein/HYR domain
MKPNLQRRARGALGVHALACSLGPDTLKGGHQTRKVLAAASTIIASLFLSSSAVAQVSPSYTVTNLPGFNLIANQLTSPNGNTIGNVIPSAPFGSMVLRWDIPTAKFQTAILTATGGWQPSTMLLNPGDGLEFSNSSAANFVMTFSGSPHVPVLPVTLNGLSLLARQTNGIGTITNILGVNPPNQTVVYQFIPGPGHDPSVFTAANYIIYALSGGVWTTPAGPPNNIPIGASVWITTNGSAPSVTTPKDASICPSNRAIFSVTASGSPPLSYQWFHGSNPISGATAPSYTIVSAQTADLGTYAVKVTNPLGSTTSSNATLSFSSLTLTCPSNIIVSCRGSKGTAVSFTVGISDPCDPNATVVSVPPSGSLFPLGTTTVVSTGTDQSGNRNSCSFTVTVVDNLAPSIVCPADRIVIATSPQGAPVSFTVTASDNCDPNPTVTATPPSGSIFPLGTTVVAAFATDANGNQSSCSFNITVAPASCCQGKLWGPKDVNSPGGRFGHAMAYDSARGRVVLFGGNSPAGLLGDTWEWDGASWTLMTTSGPPARAFTAMAYDSRIGRTVLYGGQSAQGILADTWLWDGVSWQPVQATTSPGPRYDHAMAYDSSRGRTVLYAGISGTTRAEQDDIWEFDGAQWFSVSPGTVTPGARAGHAMAYGSAQGQLLVFGGERAGKYFADTWQWNGSAWTQLAATGPGARAFHGLAYNDNCDSVVLFGGFTGTNYLSDTWEWSGNAWNLAGTNAPSARGFLALAHHSASGQTVLFGGTVQNAAGQAYLGDTWVFGQRRTAPQVLSTYAACNDQTIVVAFSAPLDPVTAQNPSNYVLSCAGALDPITQAILSDDPRIVWLYLAQPLSSNPLQGGCCSLTINGVSDLCGHALRQYGTTVCCTTEPCSRGSAGSEYWLTFPGNYAPDPTNPPAPQLFIAGASGVFGSVSIPGYPAWPPALFVIPAAGVATVTLPAAADLGNANDLIQTNAIHVVATQPVSVYGHNHIRYTTDSYLGLSTRGLGKSYMVLAYQNKYGGAPELNGVQFALAAPEDNTAVVIVPSVGVGVHAPNVPFNLTLMRGQTYQLRDTNDYPADLTGTLIISDRPIAVFGSHQCANIPNSNTFFCDYIVEQLPPTELWGTSFVTVPLATRLNGDTFRILALFNSTTVNTNGVAIPLGPLNQGKYFEIQLASGTQITSDKPVLVAQYADSSDFDFVPNSDPFMVLVPPTALFATSYIVETPTVDFTGNYLNLMAPASAVGQINLDGTAISPAAFSAIGASGYYGAQITVGTGPHTLFSSNSLPFGVIVYGWNTFDSYGYPGGTCNTPLGRTTEFSCPATNVVLDAGPGCVAPVPDLTALVGNGSSAVLILQKPQAGTLLPPGAYTITLTIVDQFGQRHLCASSLTINQTTGAGLQCPPNIVTNCASAKGQVVFYQVNVCNPNVSVSSSPPSGSLFPPGTTTVSCVATNSNGVVEKCSFTVTVNCVSISVTHSASNLTLSWPGSAVLQKATSVAGPWLTLSNAISPYQVPASGRQGYFRVTISP